MAPTPSIVCRGVRGATTVAINERDTILAAVRELLGILFEANGIEPPDVASILFSATPDLNAAFPAEAARELGLANVPLLCMQEIPVPHTTERCLRVLIHWNTGRGQAEIEHVYLHRAAALRPDWRWPREG